MKAFDSDFVLFLFIASLLAGDDIRMHVYLSQLPHHVVSRVGEIIVADYWTTNRQIIKSEFLPGSFIAVTKTNNLW